MSFKVPGLVTLLVLFMLAYLFGFCSTPPQSHSLKISLIHLFKQTLFPFPHCLSCSVWCKLGEHIQSPTRTPHPWHPWLSEIKCELIPKYQQCLNFKLTYLQWDYACWLPSSSGKLTVTIIGVIMQFPRKNHIGFITVYINCHKYQL